MEATTSAEMASTRRNGRRSNVHMMETIEALRNQVEVLQTEVRSKPLTPAEPQRGTWDQIRGGRNRGRGGFRGSFRGRGGLRGGMASYNQGRGECWTCGKHGHMSRDCPQSIYYLCHKTGHAAVNCPGRSINMANLEDS